MNIAQLKISGKIMAVAALCSIALLSAVPVLAGSEVTDIPKSGVLKGVVCAGHSTAAGDFGSGNTGVSTMSGPCGLCDFIMIFTNIASLIVALSGGIAVLMFVYAGLMYLTASFKPDNVTKAKAAISATVIGLAFIFGGYAIINFVILTLVGGTKGMTGPFQSITKKDSWGVCTGYGTPPRASTDVNGITPAGSGSWSEQDVQDFINGDF